MNRTDRLYAVVEELRARAPRALTCTALADRFEVSVRTIQRDVLALQHAGVPIWSRPGPGGGYTIDPRRTLPPLNLSAEEATALATALAAVGPMPFGDAARSAGLKLAAVMSEEGSMNARSLASRVRVAPSTTLYDKVVLRSVEEAVAGALVIELEYVDRLGQMTRRAVEAHGLLGSPDGWYLAGWCRLREDGRTFRLDRIRWAAPTQEKAAERDLDAVLDVPFPVVLPALVHE